ncbi:MAG: ankyrin repeat domain-containing protein [Porticoccaceae bacterium]|nr:ankyrin repeat domain-containing protein [Porticoccaceae bacterium]
MAQPRFSESIRSVWAIGFLLFSLTICCNAAQLEDAKVAIRTRQYEQAHEILAGLAKSGDSEAQYLLASLYSAGIGTHCDYQTSAFWLTQAAEQGHIKARYDLGALYESGRGVEKNSNTALDWFQKAAAQGNRRARLKLESPSALQATALTGANPLATIFLQIRNNDFQALRRLLQSGTQGYDVNASDKYGITPLIYAVEQGQDKFVRLFLSNGASVNYRNRDGQSALMVAARRKHPSIVKQLLSFKADIDAQDNLGNTALHLATRKNHTEIAKLLLAKSGNLGATNHAGKTVLDLAIEGDNRQTITLLKSKNAPQTVTTRSHTGNRPGGNTLAENAMRQLRIANKNQNPFNSWPALNLAAWRGKPEHVKSLLKITGSGHLNVDSVDPEQHSPLSRAAWQGHASIVDMLLGAGADPNHRLTNGDTPLRLAIRFGHPDVVKSLLKSLGQVEEGKSKIAMEPLLNLAARKGHEVIGLALIKFGGNTDSIYDDRTALMWAAQHGLNRLLVRLTRQSPSLNQQDGEGRTALRLAVEGKQLESVKILLNAKADFSVSDYVNNTPLAYAAILGYTEIVNQLLSRSKNFNEQNLSGNTPLMLAARKGNGAVTQILVDSGADVAHRNKRGDTALMLAAQQGHLAVVKILLEHGANPKRRSRSGKTAAELALIANQEAVAKLVNKHTSGNRLMAVFR